MEPSSGVLGDSRAVRIADGGAARSGPEPDSLDLAVRAERSSVPVATVGSTGLPALEPLVLATVDGRTAYLPRCSPDRLREAVRAVEDGGVPTEGAAHTVDHDPGVANLPRPTTGPLAVGMRWVLGGCGWVVPTSVEDYVAATGTLLSAESDGLVEAVAASGLRGRGRGDLATDRPVADPWRTVQEGGGSADPVVVVNANEADEGARMDQLLLSSCPLAVLDPAVALAEALGATDVVVYLNEADRPVRDRAERAAGALSDERSFDARVAVAGGPDSYTAGEPTMALESLEGSDRLEARRRPPGPEEHGLYGRPTLVHTPRTLAQVGALVRTADPPGVPSDVGTRVFTVGGDVAAPATVELSTDADLSALSGAVEPEGRVKAACVGGRFGGITESLDVPASAGGLTSAGLGTGGALELLGERRCLVALVGERARTASEENCGRCVPCREGSKQLTRLLREVYDGEYDGAGIRELGRVMRRTSICDFGREASRPALTAMNAFEEEFSAHADGRCPAGVCAEVRP